MFFFAYQNFIIGEFILLVLRIVASRVRDSQLTEFGEIQEQLQTDICLSQ